MDIRNRIITKFNLDNKFQLAGDLIEKLILFENVIIDSTQFHEIPLLVNTLGYHQTIELLNSGFVKVYIDNYTFGLLGNISVSRLE